MGLTAPQSRGFFDIRWIEAIKSLCAFARSAVKRFYCHERVAINTYYADANLGFLRN
jgi:hypothetical protein